MPSLEELAVRLNITKRNNKFQTTSWEARQNRDSRYFLSELMYQVLGLCELAEYYRNKKLFGFKEPPERAARTVPEALMLIVTEIGEAVTAWLDDDIDGFKEEFVDIIIRVLDTAVDLDIHKGLEAGICFKDIRNQKRGFRHGGKTA